MFIFNETLIIFKLYAVKKRDHEASFICQVMSLNKITSSVIEGIEKMLVIRCDLYFTISICNDWI